MKKVLILLSLIISLCFSKDDFISMCKNPTSSQIVTLKAMLEIVNNDRINQDKIKFENQGICEFLDSEFKVLPYLISKNITDISILKYFPDTGILNLRDNQITDITVLKYLTKLEKLELMGNTITEGLDSLKDLPLKKLSISFGKNTDISPLGNIKTLEDIHIRGGENYEVFNNLTNLNDAWFNSLEITDLCKLANLKSLDRLVLRRNNLKSLKCIDNFKNLTYLDIENNQITDLTPLIKMDKLKELVIRDTPIEDISPLAKMKNLNSFHFSRTKIKYLSPLSESKSIEFAEDSSERFIEEYFNRSLAGCSPKSMYEVREGKSCFEKDGTLKPFWKRWLRI